MTALVIAARQADEDALRARRASPAAADATAPPRGRSGLEMLRETTCLIFDAPAHTATGTP